MAEATLLRGFRPHFAEIEGVSIRWFERGEGDPILLVHGLGGAATNWTRMAPSLAERRRVLVPDLPGHGASGPPRAGVDLGWYADVLAGLLEHAGAAPAAVAGHSLGGVLVLRLAVRRSEAVSSLALFESAGIVSLTRAAAVFLGLSGILRPAHKAAMFRHRIARSPRLRRVIFGFWGADDAESLDPEAVLGFLEWAGATTDTTTAARALLRDDPRYELDAIRCPALVVWGARDRLTPVGDGFEFARRLRAPIRIVAGAGHLLTGERPGECVAILEQFLDGRNNRGPEHPFASSRTAP